jgi:hypothetical protein
MRFGGFKVTCLKAVRPFVDNTISALSNVDFRDDPIAGRKYARATSIVSSAYKRHGKIIERALYERLRQNNRLSVWTDDTFCVSPAAENTFSTSSHTDCLVSELPYGQSKRTLQIDLTVFDEVSGGLSAYEVKRGNGNFDSGKIRSVMRDLLCTHMCLKSYGKARGHPVQSAEAKIIFYYGVRSIPKPYSLVREELDDHFQFPVAEAIEEVNGYFVVLLPEVRYISLPVCKTR